MPPTPEEIEQRKAGERKRRIAELEAKARERSQSKK